MSTVLNPIYSTFPRLHNHPGAEPLCVAPHQQRLATPGPWRLEFLIKYKEVYVVNIFRI
jgi:hypothetical protein